jgi:hypothetical protein
VRELSMEDIPGLLAVVREKRGLLKGSGEIVG